MGSGRRSRDIYIYFLSVLLFLCFGLSPACSRRKCSAPGMLISPQWQGGGLLKVPLHCWEKMVGALWSIPPAPPSPSHPPPPHPPPHSSLFLLYHFLLLILLHLLTLLLPLCFLHILLHLLTIQLPPLLHSFFYSSPSASCFLELMEGRSAGSPLFLCFPLSLLTIKTGAFQTRCIMGECVCVRLLFVHTRLCVFLLQ